MRASGRASSRLQPSCNHPSSRLQPSCRACCPEPQREASASPRCSSSSLQPPRSAAATAGSSWATCNPYPPPNPNPNPGPNPNPNPNPNQVKLVALDLSKHPSYRNLLRFDGPDWRHHLASLKPLGLCSVLNSSCRHDDCGEMISTQLQVGPPTACACACACACARVRVCECV